jgi:hypothetical protein
MPVMVSAMRSLSVESDLIAPVTSAADSAMPCIAVTRADAPGVATV